MEEVNLSEMVGQKASIRGQARDAKGGAVLLIASGEPVYLKGVDCWPDEVHGKEVIVTGVVNEENYILDPVISEDGAISQGAEGDQWVFEDPEWKVV